MSNRADWNVRSQTIWGTRNMFRKGLVVVGVLLLWAAITLLSLAIVASAAHGQQVDVSQFPGSSVGAKLTNAAADTSAGGGCITGLTCILFIPPQMSVYATGTLPTMGANQMAISYMDPANIKVMATGASVFSNLTGATFNGGTITTPILAADGSTLAPSYAFSSNTDVGFHYGTTGGSNIAVSIDNADAIAIYSAQLRLGASSLGWGAGLAANDLVLTRDGAGNILAQKNGANGQTYRVYGSTTGPAYASFSANTAACTGAAASVGVFCWDSSLNKWRYSENNGAFANAFATAGNTPDWSGFCNGTASAGSTLALFGMGGGAAGSSACTSAFSDNRTHVMTAAGTITKLYVKCGTGGVNASSGVFTVMKNNSAQTVTTTLGVSTSNNDVAHSFAYVAGDTIGIQFTTQAAETLADCRASIQ